jgi:hypothetical protein
MMILSVVMLLIIVLVAGNVGALMWFALRGLMLAGSSAPTR